MNQPEVPPDLNKPRQNPVEFKKAPKNEIENALYNNKGDFGMNGHPNAYMPVRPETAQSSRPPTSYGMDVSNGTVDYMLIDRPETGNMRPGTSSGIDRPTTSSGK